MPTPPALGSWLALVLARLARLACLALPLLAASCDDDDPGAGDAARPADAGAGDGPGGESSATVDGPGGGDGGPGAGLTYYQDIGPILHAKCVTCHQEGGIGPLRLDTADHVSRFAMSVAQVTKVGYMPPYSIVHDGSCGQFDSSPALTQAEKDKLWDWAHSDKAIGTPTTLAVPPKPGLGPATEYRTPTLTPAAQGGTLAEFDEYRCFPVASPLTEDSFITGYEVLPGNPALVHHLIAFLIDPNRVTRSGRTNAQVMAELDAQDPGRPGWTCFGLAGEGVELDAVPAIWAPGQGPVAYPNGVGVPHRTGHQVVIQLHYNLSDATVRGQSDTTTVRFRHSRSVERKGIFVVEDRFLDSIFSNSPRTLPPGQALTSTEWTASLRQLGAPANVPYLDLLGMMPHMHERGVSKQISLREPGGQASCAARVDRWDFNWQRFYFYSGAPLRVTPQTEVNLRCNYDTLSATAPVSPGWGTRNEMCTAIFMLALPPGS